MPRPAVLWTVLACLLLPAAFLSFHLRRQRPLDDPGLQLRARAAQAKTSTEGVSDAEPPGNGESTPAGAEVDLAAELALAPRGQDVVGEVVDEADGSPLAGCLARLWSSTGIHATQRTDEAGRFGFQLPDDMDPGDTWVEIGVPDGWTIEEPTIDLWSALDSARRSDEGLRFLARQDPLAPLRFRLVDALDGSLVPDYQLIFRRPDGGFEQARSDREGWVETHTRYPAGGFQFYERDHPLMRPRPFVRTAVSAQQEVVEATARIAVHPGPSFDLELVLPSGVPAHRFEAIFASELERYLGGEQLGPRAPLRGEPGAPWVRFPPLAHLYSPADGPFWLQIVDSGGEWFGAARVETLRGRFPRPLPIALTRLARLEGKVLTSLFEREAQLASDVLVRMDPIELDPTQAAMPWREPQQNTGSNGVFEFKGLFPGAYRLRAQSRAGETASHELVLAAGEATRFDLQLAPVPCGALRGQLRSRPTNRQPAVFLRLEPLGGATDAMTVTTRLHWQERTRPSLALVDFGRLPLGEYRLSAFGSTADWSFDPLPSSVSPPRAELELVVQEGRSLDAASRPDAQSTGPMLIRYRIGELIREESFAGDSFALVDAVPTDIAIRWVVLAEGRRPVFGREQDLQRLPESGLLGARILRSELEPGWGRIISVRTRSDQPMDQVTIRLDDAPCGQTWSDGRAIVGSDRRPDELVVERSGWSVVGYHESGLTIQFYMARD